MRKFISQDEYIKRCKNVWGDRYDLSQVVYTGCLNTVDVICRKHGIFHPNARSFTNGHGCPECQKDTIRAALTKTTDDFVKRAKLVHGDKYDYSKVDYKGVKAPIIIICPEHGEFEQRPDEHLAGKGCAKCYGNARMTTEEFISRAKEVHGERYDYSITNCTSSNGVVEIICREHGAFSQQARMHLKGRGCPRCSSSLREVEIRTYLTEHNIEFEEEKVFPDCRDIQVLRFDFYLSSYNLCIEHQGKLHYEKIDFFGDDESFEGRQRRDNIKREYCKEHGIELMEIRYDEDIHEVLDKYFCGKVITIKTED